MVVESKISVNISNAYLNVYLFICVIIFVNLLKIKIIGFYPFFIFFKILCHHLMKKLKEFHL